MAHCCLSKLSDFLFLCLMVLARMVLAVVPTGHTKRLLVAPGFDIRCGVLIKALRKFISVTPLFCFVLLRPGNGFT